MRHTISLEIDELNPSFIKQLKILLKNARNRRLTIILEDEMDETEYLLKSKKNEEILMKSLENARKGNFIETNLDSFRELADA